jgi:ATP-dependent DNA helicase PIF1
MPTLDDLLRHIEPTQGDDAPSTVPCEFLTGAAGTGKTFQVKQAIEANPKYGELTATTGIAAINLNAKTLNSVLKYFDTESLRDRFNRGSLAARLHTIGKKVRRLVIDEVSMMDGRQLDYLYKATEACNTCQDMQDKPFGIVLTGDFCQLPPVKAPWAFEAECWKYFERNTQRLTKCWRQDNVEFLEAINEARAGHGSRCVEILIGLGVKFIPQQDFFFKGTTILSKNDQVDNFNYSKLLDVKGSAFSLKTLTWGDTSGEWKNIPQTLQLKEGALVMILANDSPMFSYVNGDCGYVQSKGEDGTIYVKLLRNESIVGIRPITRYAVSRGKSIEEKGLDKLVYDIDTEHLYCEDDCGQDEPKKRYSAWGKPSYNCPNGTWNTGAIKYYPLRLCYATTIHKSQGLTLDTCQIDFRDPFFSNPSMGYVALSRCRTPQGLVLVGDPNKLADRIKCDPKVQRWL